MSANQHVGFEASRGGPEHATPAALFEEVDREFGFTLDAAAQPHNAKCPAFFTPEQDGLTQEWGGLVWCNPPYGRGIGKWVRKGYESSAAGATVVMLLPASTDVAWFHDWALRGEVRFIRGRLKFGDAAYNAPFGSILVVFRPPNQ